MSLPNLQSILIVMLVATFVLLSIFGESSEIFLIIGLVLIAFLLFKKNIVRKETDTYNPGLCYASVGFVLWTWASIFWSVSIPSSISRAVFLTFGIIFYWFFKLYLNRILTLVSFQSFILAFSVFLVLLQIITGYNTLSVGVNNFNSLISSGFGHSHVASFYLVSLPFSLLLLKKNLKLGVFITSTIFLGLVISFGRVAIALAIGELLIFSLYFHKGFQAKAKKILFAFVFIFSTFFFVQVFFTLIPQFSRGDKCLIPLLSSKICKPILDESRIEYWSQALKAISSRPLLGWGGGTFPILSRKFKFSITSYTGYAHNDLLQLTSEYGLAGTFLLLMMLLPTLKAVIASLRQKIVLNKDFMKSNEPYYICLSLGWLSIVVNSLFDYSLNFYLIWVLFMIISSMLVREKSDYLCADKYLLTRLISSKHASPKLCRKIYFVIVKDQITFFSVPIIVLSFLYVTSSLMWSLGYYDLAVKVFPLVNRRVEAALQHKIHVTSETTGMIRALYRSHTPYMRLVSQNNVLFDKKIDLQDEILSWEPLDLNTRLKAMQGNIIDNNTSELLVHVEFLTSLIDSKDQGQLKFTLSNQILEEIIDYANLIADHDQQKALELTLFAYRINPWLVDDVPSVFLYKPLSFSKDNIDRIIGLKNIPSDLWRYEDSLGPWYIQRAVQDARSGNWSVAAHYIHWALNTSTKHSVAAWESLSDIFHKQLDESLKTGNCPNAKNLLSSWNQILLEISGTKSEDSNIGHSRVGRHKVTYQPEWWQDLKLRSEEFDKKCDGGRKQVSLM